MSSAGSRNQSRSRSQEGSEADPAKTEHPEEIEPVEDGQGPEEEQASNAGSQNSGSKREPEEEEQAEENEGIEEQTGEEEQREAPMTVEEMLEEEERIAKAREALDENDYTPEEREAEEAQLDEDEKRLEAHKQAYEEQMNEAEEEQEQVPEQGESAEEEQDDAEQEEDVQQEEPGDSAGEEEQYGAAGYDDEEQPMEYPDSSIVFVNNLNHNVSSSDLGEVAANSGTVLGSVVEFGHEGHHLGYGFVVLSNIKEAHAFIEATNGKELGGTTLESEIYEESEDLPYPIRCDRLFLSNFPTSYTADDILNFIGNNIGENEVCQIFTDVEYSYALLGFADPSQIGDLVNSLNGMDFAEDKEVDEGDEENDEEGYKLYADFAQVELVGEPVEGENEEGEKGEVDVPVGRARVSAPEEPKERLSISYQFAEGIDFPVEITISQNTPQFTEPLKLPEDSSPMPVQAKPFSGAPTREVTTDNLPIKRAPVTTVYVDQAQDNTPANVTEASSPQQAQPYHQQGAQQHHQAPAQTYQHQAPAQTYQHQAPAQHPYTSSGPEPVRTSVRPSTQVSGDRAALVSPYTSSQAEPRAERPTQSPTFTSSQVTTSNISTPAPVTLQEEHPQAQAPAQGQVPGPTTTIIHHPPVSVFCGYTPALSFSSSIGVPRASVVRAAPRVGVSMMSSPVRFSGFGRTVLTSPVRVGPSVRVTSSPIGMAGPLGIVGSPVRVASPVAYGIPSYPSVIGGGSYFSPYSSFVY